MDSALRRAVAAAQELVLPVDCAGCGRAGPAVCPACRRRLEPELVRREVGGVPVASGLVYDGAVRATILAFKNEGRTAIAAPLAAALRAAVAVALYEIEDDGLPIALVPMPRTARSARERGYEPVRVLLRRARLPRTDALRLRGRTADQVRLGREARFTNVAAGMRALPRIAGRRVILIDDVVTTGATLAEAARAVGAAGGVVLAAATVASTPKWTAGR